MTVQRCPELTRIRVNVTDTRVCGKCGEAKPRTEYSIDREGRPRTKCKACVRTYGAEWRRRPGRKERQVLHRRRANLASFGLSPEHYDLMLEAQEGGCAICAGACKTGKPLAVDHDHTTGRVRALLCFICNARVGLVENQFRHWRRYEEVVAKYLASYGAGNPLLPPGVGLGPLKRELKPLKEKGVSGRNSCRLTDAEVVEIRRRYAAGETQRALGLEFGVVRTTVSRIVNRKAWEWIA